MGIFRRKPKVHPRWVARFNHPDDPAHYRTIQGRFPSELEAAHELLDRHNTQFPESDYVFAGIEKESW
jgi:hypothetical protein